MGKVEAKIEINLNFYNEYHIGGGKGSGLIDSYVIKDYNKTPYIPASTIKGRLRHQFSQILNSSKETFCNYKSKDDCQCMVCTLFGAEGNRQGIFTFEDLKVNSDIFKGNYYSQKTGIQINRYTKLIKDQALFNLETSGLAGRLEFNGKITGFLDSDSYQKEIAYLLLGLKMIKTLGGNQSRGLGWLGDKSQFKVFIDDKEITKEELGKWGEVIAI